MKLKISKEKLPMTYSEKELSEIIRAYMRDNESFSFEQICSYIFTQAKREERIKKEQDTEYQGGIEITYNDEIVISKLLWEEIWNKKLFINFSKNPYFIHSNEIQFMVKK